jgi:flagellar basal-body rod protein FlgF
MSSKGIYPALSGAIAQSQRLDTIANNLANVNTTAFKKDKQVFNEYLTSFEKQDTHINVPKIPASIESFYDMQGGDKSYVNSTGTYTDHSQGQVKPTGNPLDVAIEGKGFLEVLTPQGVRFTRNGALKIDNQGRLVTKEGHPVLAANANPDPANRAITLSSSQIVIGPKGDIFEGENQIAKLSVVEFSNPDSLQKVGSSFYTLKPNFQAAALPSNDSNFVQGSLEGSNINVVEEMVNMIEASRVFESTQQAIKAHDQMDSKLVNEVAKT